MTAKEKILEDLRRSRVAITRDANAIVEEVNLVSKFKKSVRNKPLAWLGGAAALGWILSGPKTRVVTKTVKGKSLEPAKKSRLSGAAGLWSILLALFKIAYPLARPALSAYAARRVGEFAEKFSR
jgi:hypothetical protein